jgi:hypothetical protein
MSHAELIQAVRSLATDVFLQLWRENTAPREAILLHNGLYCGRKFEVPAGHAIWSFESDQLEIRSPDGAVQRVIERVSAVEPARRKAA